MKRILFFCIVILALYSAGVVAINLPKKATPISQDTSFTVPTPTTTSSQPSSKLKSQDEKVGTGTEAKTGDTVTVNYIGTLSNGKKFDSSYDRNQPFSFTLGAGQVIKGWDQGVIGMKVGGKRKLTIPPELGYGNTAQGAIPANSTLIFDIELASVTSSNPQQSQNPNLNL